MEVVQRVTRRERERLMRRQEIIEAARTIFARKGFNDAKLEDVAELAEFGKGTLYNYFTNKEALFRGVLEDSFEKVWSLAAEAFAADVSLQEKVERFVHDELSFFFRHPESLYLMMRESHHLQGNNPMMSMLPQLLNMISESIALEQKRKTVIHNAEPLALATILINMLFGQFSSRFYQSFCVNNADVKRESEVGPLPFRAMSETEAEREAGLATKLIVTVYFNGITR